MALQTLPNSQGLALSPFPGSPKTQISVTSTAINAAGESFAGIGQIFLQGGPGSSKTISSSGGKIHFRTGSITWANAGTNLRVGIQDVAATGLEDGTYDVRADLVPGTDTLTATALNVAAMETGSKTITHGDFIAVVIEMTTLGGADSVTVSKMGNVNIAPYSTNDTGSGPAKNTTNNEPMITIEFDDGTVGWLGRNFAWIETFVSYNSGSTPDEYATVFQLPFKGSIIGAYIYMTSISATDDFEVILYSDPLGTPVAERTTTIDATYTAAPNTGYLHVDFSTAYTCLANTNYAIAVRATTANNIAVYYLDQGDTVKLKPTALGTNWYLGSRTNQTGAFSTTTTQLPLIEITVNALDDGLSTGTPFIIGG